MTAHRQPEKYADPTQPLKTQIPLQLCRLSGEIVVRMKGLEPIRRETLDPKSSAATNYATCAICQQSYNLFFNPTNFSTWHLLSYY